MIKSELDNSEFRAHFGDGPPIVIEGYAGWQVTNRPKGLGIVEWQGRNPLAIEIPFVIDYYLSNLSDRGVRVERKVSLLEKLCGVGSGNQPPICIVDSGGVIPHDHTKWKGGRWVIEALSWDREFELRLSTGRRVRCGGTITIRQFVTSRDLLRKIGAHDRAKKPSPYRVKSGDTLSKIANFYYRDPSKWRIIADANHIRDRRHLKVGDKLKIPAL